MLVQIKMHQTMQVQKSEVDCTKFCKWKELCETWKDILKITFGKNEPQQLKRRR